MSVFVSTKIKHTRAYICMLLIWLRLFLLGLVVRRLFEQLWLGCAPLNGSPGAT
jgi:hypothetical protein